MNDNDVVSVADKLMVAMVTAMIVIVTLMMPPIIMILFVSVSFLVVNNGGDRFGDNILILNDIESILAAILLL